MLVLTFGGDGSAVKLYNFLGDGQAQAGSACGSAPGGIQTEELLKNLAQLLRRDGFATVFHPDRCLLPLLLQMKGNGCLPVAVVHSVSEQVVKYPLQLVRVAEDVHVGGQLQRPGQALFSQGWLKLIGHLLQHAGQVHLLFCQGQVGQAEPGDVKKFIDQVLQTLSLVQGDAGVFGPQLLGDLGLVPEEGEVANDTGERGLEVVGQVDNQVVFPLLCLLSGPGVPEGAQAHLVQLILRLCQVLWQQNGLLTGVSQLPGGCSHLIQIPKGPGNEAVGDPGPAQEKCTAQENQDVILYKGQHLVQGVRCLPDEEAANAPCQ